MTQEIETYYRAALEYGLACVCFQDEFSGPSYRFVRIRDIKNGRIYTAYGAFWAKSGKKCDQRYGGGRASLVVPTTEILDQLQAFWDRAKLTPGSEDRSWELQAARAVLEGHTDIMPEPPPPPVPTVEEAEAELRAAEAHYETADVKANNPGAYQRVRRNAERRLEKARDNLERAKKGG